MRTSEATNELAQALAAAQGELRNPTKNAENPHFKSDYTTLDEGLNVIRPVLSKHGISFCQAPEMEGEFMVLVTRLTHKSGQWQEGVWPLVKFPARQQEIASANTYARRNALFSMVGVAGSTDDDDGNEASKDKTPAPDTRKGPPAPPPSVKDTVRPYDVQDSIRARDAMLDALTACSEPAFVREWEEQYRDELRRLLPADRQLVLSAREDALNKLKAA